MKTHAERFRHLLQVWGLTQEELGQLCGIKRGTVGTIVNGKTTPDGDALGELLRNRPDLNPDWLLTGSGPMLRDGKVLTPVVQTFAPSPAINSGPATVAEAENVLLREQVAELKADKAFLLAELGKFGSSPEAAGLPVNVPHHPAGFAQAARQQVAAEFDAFVARQLEQVEVGR